MTDFTTTARGDRVAYDLRGDGPAVIFVAGAGPFRAIDPWTTETAELAARAGIRTLVFDRLGRGESPAAGRLDLDRELAAIASLIELVGGSAVLCGHSSGCSISLAAAARGLPVTGLVLWEAPFGPQDGPAREWAAEVERRIDAGDLEGALAYYMKDMPPEWLERREAVARLPRVRRPGRELPRRRRVARLGRVGADGRALPRRPRTRRGAARRVDVPRAVRRGRGDHRRHPRRHVEAGSRRRPLLGAGTDGARARGVRDRGGIGHDRSGAERLIGLRPARCIRELSDQSTRAPAVRLEMTPVSEPRQVRCRERGYSASSASSGRRPSSVVPPTPQPLVDG